MNLVINRVCGQFVVLDPATSRLVMVHQTARDHIISTDSELGVNAAEGHKRLFINCLAVLEEKHHQLREFGPQSTDGRPSLKGELFHYAITSWAYHLDKISSNSDAPLLLLAKFLKGNHVLECIFALARNRRLRVLVSSAKTMNIYVSGNEVVIPQ